MATFTVTPVLASFLLPERVEETETIVVRILRPIYTPVLIGRSINRKAVVGIGGRVSGLVGLLATRLGSEFLPALEEGNLWIRASMPPTMALDAGTGRRARCARSCSATPKSSRGLPARPAGQWQRASPFSNVELFVPLKPYDEWPAGFTKDQLIAQLQQEFNAELPGVTFNFSQYIQDNIEEALSGVKGANSVKIIGPNLKYLGRTGRLRSMHEMAQVRGMADLGIFHIWDSQT